MTRGWGTTIGRRTWVWLLGIVASALLFAPQAATAATPQYSLEFNSTINDRFLGLNHGPTGTITNEYQAVVPLTASATNPGLFQGSGEGTYVKTTGTASTALTCENGTQQTNNEQIDKSGNPAAFSAAYDPSTQNLALSTGLPTETYEETTSNPACLTPFLPIDVPQPLWYSGFTAMHRGAVSLAGANTFVFTSGSVRAGPRRNAWCRR